MAWNVFGLRQPRRAPRRGFFQPHCETLEDRNLLSGAPFELPPDLQQFLNDLVQTFTPPAVTPPITPSQLAPLGNVIVSKHFVGVTPGGAGDSFTVKLASVPASDVTLTFEAVSLGFFGGGDLANALTITPMSVTFTPANATQEQTISVALQTAVSPFDHHAFLIATAASADPQFNGTWVPPVSVAVVPPLPATLGRVIVSQHIVAVDPGGTATYSLKLATPPTSDVTITISPGLSGVLAGGSSLTIAPMTVTFTPTNSNVEQFVTVTAAADVPIGDRFTLLVHTVASADPAYNGIPVAPVGVVVTGPIGPPVFDLPPFDLPPFDLPPFQLPPFGFPPIAFPPFDPPPFDLPPIDLPPIDLPPIDWHPIDFLPFHSLPFDATILPVMVSHEPQEGGVAGLTALNEQEPTPRKAKTTTGGQGAAKTTKVRGPRGRRGGRHGKK